MGLSVVGSVFRFQYNFQLERALPLVSRLNSAQRDTGSEATAQTILLDSAGRPWKSFPPSSDVVLSMQDVLSAVHGFPQHLHVGAGEVPWEIFRDGLELIARVECYNDAGTLHRVADGKLDSLNIGREPMCLLILSYSRCCADMASWSHDAGGDIIVDRAVTLRTRSTMSIMKFVDMSKIVACLTSMLVLLSLPRKFMRWFIATFLGQLSTLYGRVFEQVFDIQRETASMAILLMSNSVAFLELSDVDSHRDQLPGISLQRMTERMQQVMRQRRKDLDDSEVAAFVDCCYRSLIQDKGDESTVRKYEKFLPWHKSPTVEKEMIDVDTFNNGCSFNSPVNLETAVRLFDKDRQRRWLERVFTPPGLRRALRMVQSVSLKKDVLNEDCPPAEPPLDADYEDHAFAVRSTDAPSTCQSVRSISVASVDEGKPERTRITKRLTLEAQKEQDSARLREHTKNIEELARRLEKLEEQQQQLSNKAEDLRAEVEQQTQDGAKSFAAALDDFAAMFEKRQLDLEQKYNQHLSIHERSLGDLFQQLAALDVKLKELPPLQTASDNPSLEAVGTGNGGVAVHYPGELSKYREPTDQLHLSKAAGGHQLLQQGNARGQHLKSSEAVEARPRPLEEAWQVSLEEALVLKHVKPLAAELDKQRQSFELLVGCLNGCLDVQQPAEPVAKEKPDNGRWLPDRNRGQRCLRSSRYSCMFG